MRCVILLRRKSQPTAPWRMSRPKERVSASRDAGAHEWCGLFMHLRDAHAAQRRRADMRRSRCAAREDERATRRRER